MATAPKTSAPKTETSTATTAPTTAATGKPRIAPELTAIVSDIPMPTRISARGSASAYPFDSLEIGQCFGVKNKDARGMSSIVSNQNRKFRSDVKDESGKVVRKVETKRFETVEVAGEIAKAIEGTPLAGSKCLVYRVEPKVSAA